MALSKRGARAIVDDEMGTKERRRASSVEPRKQRALWKRAAETLGVVLLIGSFTLITTMIVELEELGMPFLLVLQELRSQPVDVLLRACSFLGFEFFFFMIPIACFWSPSDDSEAVAEMGGAVESSDASSRVRERGEERGRERGGKRGPKPKLKAGFELLVLLSSTWFFLSIVKALFARPRPYQVDMRIVTIAKEVSASKEYSFPSGHSCGSMVCWLFLYGRYGEGRTWLAAVGTLATALSSFSRLWFAVHYPHDVIAGWIMAGVFYRLYRNFGPSARTLIVLLVGMAVTAVLTPLHVHQTQVGLLLCPGTIAAVLCAMPAASSRRFSNWLVLSPLASRTSPHVLAMKKAPVWKKIARVLVGLLGVAFSFLVVARDLESAAFSEAVEFTFSALRPFFYGFIISSWIVWVAPLVCFAIGLA